MKTDLAIKKDVMDELTWEPILNAAEIGVAVKDGVVTLSGTVDTFAKKLAAERATKRVAGVTAVAEDIEVILPGSLKHNDSEIAHAIMEALKWHSVIKEDRIKMKVENGWVKAEGDVEWQYQKDAVKNAIEFIHGVKGITNLITVKPRLSAVDIQRKITSAFHRSATVDSESVSIETEGSKVILRGSVRTWAEKQDAEDAAWAAPGVSRVESFLKVEPEVYAY